MEIYFQYNIRLLRKEKRVSQQELAEAMGVTVGAVTHWEGGKSTPQFAVLVKLRQFFGVNLEALVFHDLTKGHPPDKPIDEMNSEDVKRIEEAIKALDRKLESSQETKERVEKLEEQVEAIRRRLEELAKPQQRFNK